jgi:phage protein D
MSEQPLSSLAVYSARPTVRIDEQEYPKLSELIVSMEMTENEGGLAALELRVSNVASDPSGGAALAFEDEAILRLGAVIAVYGGDENSPQEIFRGTITGLEAHFAQEGPPELVVLAEDALQQARMARRTKVRTNVTIAAVAREVAAQLGLVPVVTDFEENIGTQAQLNESDLLFLRRLLARYDGDLQVVGKELHVSPRKDVQRGSLDLQLHSQLRAARILADLAHQATEVTVTGWDPAQGQRVTGTSRGANLGPGTGQTGAQLLSRALGERRQHVGHLAATTSDEAQALADAAFDRAARRLVCVEGVAEGNPALRVGTTVNLTGLGPRFDNTYYVTSACHRFDQERGYETAFEAECAYWGGR